MLGKRISETHLLIKSSMAVSVKNHSHNRIIRYNVYWYVIIITIIIIESTQLQSKLSERKLRKIVLVCFFKVQIDYNWSCWNKEQNLRKYIYLNPELHFQSLTALIQRAYRHQILWNSIFLYISFWNASKFDMIVESDIRCLYLLNYIWFITLQSSTITSSFNK